MARLVRRAGFRFFQVQGATRMFYVFDVHTDDPPVFSTRWRWLAHLVAVMKGPHFDFGTHEDAFTSSSEAEH